MLLSLLAVGCGSDGSGGDGDAAGPRADAPSGPALSGFVTTDEGDAIAGARVTLVQGGAFVDERRTGPDGGYVFAPLAPASYEVGASSRSRAFVAATGVVDADPVRVDLALGPEIEPGRWTVIGDTEPERFAGTPSATLLPDGQVMYCHNTEDPVVVDPATGAKSYPMPSPSSQGCHMQTLLTSGEVIFVGGQAADDPGSFVDGVRTVKRYDPIADTWEVLPSLNEPRWYPTLVRLPDERLLACGGGQPPDASRTDTCELWDPATREWTLTGSLEQPTEYSPSAVLDSGEVLTTWAPPQLFSPATGLWRAAGAMVQPDRGFPDHSDHSLVLLTDGNALAVGVRASAGSAMVERYAPGDDAWRLGASPEVNRSRPEVVYLPDGRVLAAGGKYDGDDPAITTNDFRQVALADLYDPELDRWRSVAPMRLAREYHALTLLVPDGRVLTSSGTGNQAAGAAPESSVEAFEPPYLFRGPRPVITTLSSTDLARGEAVTIGFDGTRAPTAIVLQGTMAVTHWMDGGVPRRAELAFTTDGAVATAQVTADANRLPTGWYILFVLVDDIPSVGRIVRVR